MKAFRFFVLAFLLTLEACCARAPIPIQLNVRVTTAPAVGEPAAAEQLELKAASSQLGIDFLGAARYPEIVKRTLPPGWALGVFWRTFGDAAAIVEWALQSGHDVRVQGLWEDDHNYDKGRVRRDIIPIAQKLEALALKYPQRRIDLSPFCEHRLRGETARKMFARVKAAAPHVHIVNTGPAIAGYEHEEHWHGKKLLASTDGADLFDMDVRAYNRKYANARIRFGWIPSFNLKKSMSDKTPRPQRRRMPTDNEVQKVVRLLKQ